MIAERHPRGNDPTSIALGALDQRGVRSSGRFKGDDPPSKPSIQQFFGELPGISADIKYDLDAVGLKLPNELRGLRRARINPRQVPPCMPDAFANETSNRH
jgi:hypothetical protein